MKKLTYSLLLAAGVLLSVSSCVKNDPSGPCPDDPTKASGDAQIILRLKTPDGYNKPATRALTLQQENDIKDVYVLVFDSSDKLVTIKEGQDVQTTTPSPTDSDYSGTGGSFTVTLSPSHGSNDTYNLVVLANAEGILNGTGNTTSALPTIGTDSTSTYIGKSYADVRADIVWGYINGKMFDPSTDNISAIPMWAETGPITIQPGNSEKTLEMLRAVARIDVGVGAAKQDDADAYTWDGKDAAGKTIPFVLADVYPMRPQHVCYIIPDPTLAAEIPSATLGTTANTLTVDNSISNFHYATPTGYTTQEIYTPESDVLMDNGAGTAAPNDINHTNRMALVVGGSYNGGPETYYRLDFAKDKVLMNVLRNHLYMFAISSVSGPGYDTPEEAYESQAMNITVDVLDWDVSNMSGVFRDGSRYMMIGRSQNAPENDGNATLFRNTGSTDQIAFRTNVPIDQMTFELDHEGLAVTENTTEGALMTYANARFRVELFANPDGGAEDYYFLFTALEDFDTNTEANDNPSTLSISATNAMIDFSIDINQLSTAPTDWIDGGNTDKDLQGQGDE